MKMQLFPLLLSVMYSHRLVGGVLIVLFYISACNPIPPQYDINEDQKPTVAQTQNTGSGDGISINQDSLIPPIPPGQVRASLSEGYVELHWQGTGSDIDVHYIVYRRTGNFGNWEEIAILPVQDRNQGGYVFNDYSIENNTLYEYAIAVLDHYGNKSSLSETAKVETDK